MEKSLDIVLRQQMNVDEMPNLRDIPPLGERAKKLIVKRKRLEKAVTSAPSFFDVIFNRYKWVSLSFCLIGFVFSINFICKFSIDQQAGEMVGTAYDTTLTVSSNTYLATLNQSTINEVPANTSTALTCISTFKN